MELTLPYGVRRTSGGKRLKYERPAAIHLPYESHLDAHTLGLNDGRMMQVVAIEGFSFETESDEALQHNVNAFHTLLQTQQRGGYTLYSTLIRRKEDIILEGEFPPGYAAGLNDRWLNQFRENKPFVNELYLTIVQQADESTTSWWPFRKAPVNHLRRERKLREIHQVTQGFMELMRDFGTRRLGVIEREVRPGITIVCSEVCEFLSKIMNHDNRPFLKPMESIGTVLGKSTRLYFPHRTIVREHASALDNDYSAILSLTKYAPVTFSEMFDELLKVPHEIIVTQSFEPLPAEHIRPRLELLKSRREAARESRAVIANIDEAIDRLAIGEVAYGNHHMTIECRGATVDELEHTVAKLSHLFATVGVTIMREDLGVEAAFWAQFPGNNDYIARKKRVNTNNVAAFCSFHNYPRGQAKGNYLGEALSVLMTAGDTPYYFNLHVGKLGSTCVFGRTTSGKTALCAFLITQSQKYGGQTVVLDKDSSWEISVLAHDGCYIRMQPGVSTGMNILQLPETEVNRRFMVQAIKLILEQELGAPLTRDEKERVEKAISAICDDFELPQRRMKILRQALVEERLKQAIAPWVEGGAHGWILDSPVDTVSFTNPMTAIDIGWAIKDKDARAPVMMYILHRIEEVINTTNLTRVVLEEGLQLLNDPALETAAESWALTVRKKNTFVIYSSQDSEFWSDAAKRIYESSATKIFFPNPGANTEVYTQRLGLSEAQVKLIRETHSSERKILVKHGDQTVIIKFDLSSLPGDLAVLAGDITSVRRMRELRKKYGAHASQWLSHFLKEHDHA